MKKFFEKHDLVKITLGMVLLTVILTWIIPKADFTTGELVKGDITRVGIFDFGMYSLLGISFFPQVVAFIFVLGAFYQFLSTLGAYQKLTDSLSKKVKGKEILFSLVVSFIIAVLTSLLNEYIVILAFIPFIITIAKKAGMDKISTFVATFGAMLVGILGSILNAKVAGINVNYFQTKYTDNLLEKIIFFVVIYLAYSLFNILYLRKHTKKIVVKKEVVNKEVEKSVSKTATKSTAKTAVKKSTAKKATTKKPAAKKATKASFAKESDVKVVKVSEETIISGNKSVSNGDLFENIKVSRNGSIVPLVVVGILAVLVIILAFIPWVTVFKVDWFTTATNWVLNEVKLFDVPIFSYILGTIPEFGSWDLFGATTIMLLSMVILSISYKKSLDNLIDSFVEGFKKVSKLIFILLLCYLVLEFAVIFQVIPVLLSDILGETFNIFTTGLAGIITNLFTVEYNYTVNLVYYNFASYTSNMNVVANILQLTYGFVSFFAPSSAMLFVGLSYLDIPYKDWMKYIWKFLLVALVAIIGLAFII